MSPQDFPPSRDGSDINILVNGRYVFSARPMQGCDRGLIGLTDAQRTWGGISLGPNDIVTVEPYDAFSQGGQCYIGNLEIEVGFATRKTTDTPYDQDELAKIFVQVGCFLGHGSMTWQLLTKPDLPKSDSCPWPAASVGCQKHCSKIDYPNRSTGGPIHGETNIFRPSSN